MTSEIVVGIAKALILSTEDVAEKSRLQKALDDYQNDLSVCQNGLECNEMALSNLERAMPAIRNSVSPWINYDFHYDRSIDNKYSAMATGSSPKGASFMNNFGIYATLLGGYMTEPTPGSATRPGATDKNSDYGIYHCDSASEELCQDTHTVRLDGAQRQSSLQSMYPKNPFYGKHSLTGKYASSYYIRIGDCLQPKLTSKEACLGENSNYNWYDTTNVCYSPRYAFIDNSALGGALPSGLSDLYSLAPQNIAKALVGKSVPGYMDVDTCPEADTTTETFSLSAEDSMAIVMGIILIGVFLFFLMIRLG
jgi:hypothetical protein